MTFGIDISGKLPTILCEIDPDKSSLKKSYVYTPNSQILYQRDHTKASGSDEFFYVHDRLGSVRLVVDENETTKNSYTYDPSGLDFATEVTESAENNFKFTGQWYDDQISQYYLRARMYDPELMRFTGYDPVFGKQEEPLTLHKYLYCLNNSINMVDLDGKSARVLVAPVTTVHAVRVFAIAFTAYSFSVNSDIGFDIGLMIQDSILETAAMVTAGMDIFDSITIAAKGKFAEEYPWKDKNNVDRIIDEHLKGMSGDPNFRNNKDPKGRWKRIMLGILEFFDNLKG